MTPTPDRERLARPPIYCDEIVHTPTQPDWAKVAQFATQWQAYAIQLESRLEAALASPPAGELSAELLAAVKPWLATYGPNFEYGYQHAMREVVSDVEYAKKCTCMRCRLQNAITAAEAALASPPAGETSFTDDELFYMWHAVIRHRPNCGVIDGMSATFQSDLGKKIDAIRKRERTPAVAERDALPRLGSWRIGQTIFNFLEWMRNNGYDALDDGRMADPFNVSDEAMETCWREFKKRQPSPAAGCNETSHEGFAVAHGEVSAGPKTLGEVLRSETPSDLDTSSRRKSADPVPVGDAGYEPRTASSTSRIAKSAVR